MFNRTFVSLLLVAAVSGCPGEKIVGSAFLEGGTADSQNDAGASEEEARLEEVAKALETAGPWFLAFPPGVNVSLTFTHGPGTRGGTYEATCPGGKCLVLERDAGPNLPAELREGDYMLFDANSRGEVRGVLFTDSSTSVLKVTVESGELSELSVEGAPFTNQPNRP